jgi:hypothetical protein
MIPYEIKLPQPSTLNSQCEQRTVGHRSVVKRKKEGIKLGIKSFG